MNDLVAASDIECRDVAFPFGYEIHTSLEETANDILRNITCSLKTKLPFTVALFVSIVARTVMRTAAASTRTTTILLKVKVSIRSRDHLTINLLFTY